jgi:hypothetical protein
MEFKPLFCGASAIGIEAVTLPAEGYYFFLVADSTVDAPPSKSRVEPPHWP